MLDVRILSADDGTPLAGAVVEFNGSEQDSDPAGRASTEWYQRQITVRASAPGFEPSRVEVAELPLEPLQVQLVPVVLTGRVVTPGGDPVGGASVTLAERSAVTDRDGTYRIVGAVPGEMTATRAAWLPGTGTWDGRAETVDVVLEPRMVSAVRVTAPAAADEVKWEGFIEMANESAVNAFVFDTKDETGEVKYDSGVPTVAEIGSERAWFDVSARLADMKENGVYAITRIVTFQDTPMAEAHPELAVVNSATGQVWRDNKGEAWLDPTNRASWEYPLALAEEACRLGFDEIQFDYVRFPSDGPIENISIQGAYNEANRVATIAAYLNEARRRLNPLGCAVAADIFAVVVSSVDDQGIGQQPEQISAAVDVISPMIYPTHYATGWLGFSEPNDHPAEIVGSSLEDGLARLEPGVVMRPWLQTSTYGPSEIGLEISEAAARELGWMLWSSTSIFDPASFPADTEETPVASTAADSEA
jgi:hypothetical protein